MKPQPPCLGCLDRYLGCHEKCDKYLKYKKELAEFNNMVRKEQMLERQLTASDLQRNRKIK